MGVAMELTTQVVEAVPDAESHSEVEAAQANDLGLSVRGRGRPRLGSANRFGSALITFVEGLILPRGQRAVDGPRMKPVDGVSGAPLSSIAAAVQRHFDQSYPNLALATPWPRRARMPSAPPEVWSMHAHVVLWLVTRSLMHGYVGVQLFSSSASSYSPCLPGRGARVPGAW